MLKRVVGLIAGLAALLPAAAAARTDDTPNPAIWRLADADTTIYLFGTTHALSEGLRWRSRALDAIVAESAELVLESADGAGTSAEQEDEAAAMMVALIDPLVQRPKILDRVPKKQRKALRRAIAATGVTPEDIDLLPTWMAAFMLGIGVLEQAGQKYELGVEAILEKEFRAASKPIGEIEADDAVFKAMNAMPEAEQRQLLIDSIAPIELDDMAGSDRAWAQGRMEVLDAEFTEEAMGAAIYKPLIKDRNTAWTGWLRQRLDRPGKVLVAVGAGHFAGPDAVQKMLAKQGFKVDRIH